MTSGWTEAGGFLRLDRGPVRCLFSTRGLGDMRYGRHRQEALAGAGAPEADARMLRQVHGQAISILRRGDDSRVLTQGDGWITDQPGAVLGVTVADCVPVWMWDRSGRAGGVFHAGWRGLEAGILGRAAAEFSRSFSVRPSDLEAAVGPRAGACCYEVGPEVAARFRKQSLRLAGGRTFLDLGGEARAQLLDAGLPSSAVTVSDGCTVCRPALFYSWRREGGRGPRCGQMLACLWIAKEP